MSDGQDRRVEEFETGTQKIRVIIEEHPGGEWWVKVIDSVGNFTSFTDKDQVSARMSASFLADKIRAAVAHECERATLKERRRISRKLIGDPK